MVRWSDGTMSLYLGSEIFDIHRQPLQGEFSHLFVRQGVWVCRGERGGEEGEVLLCDFGSVCDYIWSLKSVMFGGVHVQW